jgi:methylmalonyl-CoA mutase
MTHDARALARGFPEADLDAWRAAAKTALKHKNSDDAAFAEALVRRTADGIARGPLATRADLAGRVPDYAGRPGSSAPDAPSCPWDIRPVVSHPDPAEANAQALEALAGGATSIELRIDPTGAAGVMVRSLDDLARALGGVHLELAPVSLDAGDFAGPAAAMLLALRTKRGLAPEAGGGALNLDAARDDAAAWARHAADAWPGATVFRADGRAVHEAGGSEAWEIAVAAGSGIAQLEAMVAAGLDVDAAARRIALAVALDADVHLGIAKLRALRRIWRRVATAAGASSTTAAPIQAFSSRRMLTARDPWSNLMRLTAAGFAGAVGGADSVTLAPFTDALGSPTAFARRMSRNISLLLAEEAGLGRVADPARGGFHHETLTDALAHEAWARVQEIAGEGGLAAFVASGRLGAVVAESRAALDVALANGNAQIVGASAYTIDAPRPAETEEIDLAALRAAADARSATRAKADPNVRDPAALIALAESGADFGAVGAAAKGDKGMPPVRLAAPFEEPAS